MQHFYGLLGELITRELATSELEKWHGDSSFQVQEIKSWNSLPSFFPSINSFKTGLFKYLITSSHKYKDSVF